MGKIGLPEKFGFFDASETIRKIVFSAVWVHETPIFKGFYERKTLKKVRLGGRPLKKKTNCQLRCPEPERNQDNKESASTNCNQHTKTRSSTPPKPSTLTTDFRTCPPCTGVKIPKIRKRGFRGPMSNAPEKG